MIPTLLGITMICFLIIMNAPGGPIEQIIRQLKYSGQSSMESGGTNVGVSQDVIDDLNEQYGFDKPIYMQYLIWVKNIFNLDFGQSFMYKEPVWDVIKSKFPVSFQFGIISFILIYLICIPLGVSKAVADGSFFDVWTSFLLFILYSILPLMMGILLVIFFAGGSFFDWFPVGDLYSDEYEFLGFWGKVRDRIHHFVLPMSCYVVNSFTVLTFLMKNSFMSELSKDYVRTARSKGLDERTIYYKHTLKNALIPIVTGLGSFLGILLAGSLIIEQIFNLDGIGLLGYKAALSRDYNVLMALIFISSLIALVGRLISDILYTFVDPRIDFK